MDIILLHKISKLNEITAGRLATDLAQISSGGVKIVPTVLIPSPGFAKYHNGSLDDAIIKMIIDTLRPECTSDSLVVRASLADDTVWCDTDLRSGASFAELRSAVERIYCSFAGPRSRADRVARGVVDEEVKPPVVVQPDLPIVGSLLSRHAVTGEPINEDNWTDNVNNRMTLNDVGPYLGMCHSAELALGSPLHAFFVQLPAPAIINVKPPILTDRARLTALLDLFRRGILSSLGLLRRVDPAVFGYVTGRFKLSSGNRAGSVSGIAAVSGQLIGLVRLRNFSYTDRRRRKGPSTPPPVLFLAEATPDDTGDIAEAAASVGSIAGRTCHLAVMCRGMGKPCVVGTGIRIDEKNRVLVLRDGKIISEGSAVAVDANIGIIEFSDAPDLIAESVVVSHIEETRSAIIEILLRETAHRHFRELSDLDQTHLARLKYRLREISLIP